MVDYSRAFVIRAQRAIDHGISDARAFQQLALESGVSIERTAEMLQADLDAEGAIFGKFMRSLRGAAVSSVVEAHRTGDIVGHTNIKAMDLDKVLAWVNEADPEVLEDFERTVEDQDVMWVAMLVNTCHLCLPLHGTVMSRAEFKEQGLIPGAIHPDSWGSTCKCRFVPVDEIDRDAELAPLKRIPKKDEQGRKISGRTIRAVAQKDVDKSVAAVAKSQETIEGRRALRVMGQTKGTKP